MTWLRTKRFRGFLDKHYMPICIGLIVLGIIAIIVLAIINEGNPVPVIVANALP